MKKNYFQLTYWKPTVLPFELKNWYAVIMLVALGLLAYGLCLSTPALFSDDWAMAVRWNIEDTWQCPNWMQTRPLRACYDVMLYQAFGLNIFAFYIVTIIVNILIAIAFYFILDDLLPSNFRLFNIIVAALFLIYPSDYTHGWLAATSVKFPVLLFLISFLLLIYFWRRGWWWLWGASMLLLLISLGFYELHVGLVLLSSSILFWLARDRPLNHRLAILTPLIIVILFVFWFMFGTKLVGIVQIYSSDLVTISPQIVIPRMISGYRISLQWAWTEALLYFFPGLTNYSSRTNLNATIVFVLIPLLVVVLASYVARRIYSTDSLGINSTKVKQWEAITGFASIGLIGLAIIGAGYIPVISAFDVWVDYDISRYNSLASIGAALVICSLLAILATYLSHTGRQATFIFLAGILPFVTLALCAQLSVQQTRLVAWQQQKSILYQLFQLAPNLKDDTGVYIFASSYPKTLGPRPFTDGGLGLGMTSALTMLYGNNSLHGLFHYGDPSKYFTKEGIIREGLGLILGNPSPTPKPDPTSKVPLVDVPVLIPYEHVVIFEYQPQNGQLTLLKKLPADWVSELGFNPDLGLDQIITAPSPDTHLRWLVK